jgi:hypothetical protein
MPASVRGADMPWGERLAWVVDPELNLVSLAGA